MATNPQPGNLIFGRTATDQNQPVLVDAQGKLQVDVAVTAGANQLADGVDDTILATVHDYTSSNPLAVVLTDTSGVPYVVSGGGGSQAVTVADGADVAEGAIADSAVTGDNTGTVSAKLRGVNKIWADVWDSVNHWLKVSIQNSTLAVTQSGSWVLSAGSAIIGKVSIDQTTPGTTNGVQVNAALPAGTNVIGHVIADSGSTTTVTGNVTVVQPTAASLNATVVGTGTFATQAAQSGTWTVQPGNTANTTAWKVDGSAVTQPVSGTVTAAQATASSLNATVVGTGTFAVQSAAAGDVAAGSSDSGNPVKIGGKAVSAAPTAVTASQRVNGLFDLWGRLFVRSGAQAPVASTFTAVHVPATNTQATATKASAGSGKRNVCTGFTATLAAGSTAPTAATPISVAVIDGASGGGTYLWRTTICVPATANAIVSFNRSGLWLVGSQATAMTVEFSAAGGTNTYESVAIDGVVVEE